MVVYHHNDLDGKSAGYLVHRMKPRSIIDHADNYCMMGYDDPFDKHNIKDDVFIVDLSFTETTYPKLLEICKTARTVTWIDHHQSSDEVVERHKDELQAITNLTYFVSKAACGAALTYAFFNIPAEDLKRIRNTTSEEEYKISADYRYKGGTDAIISILLTKMDKNDNSKYIWSDKVVKLPQWLFHIDDFDCWKLLNPITECFKFGLEANDTAVTKYSKKNDTRYFNIFWNKLFEDRSGAVCNSIIDNGTVISRYAHSENLRDLNQTFVWNFQGIDFICMNTTKKSSMTFEYLMKKYTAAIAWNYNGRIGRWSYSVYADESVSDFNCGKFCEQFGGGGHAGAAGFSTQTCIFTDPKYKAFSKTEKAPLIFLGGTCNGDPWRTEFIAVWNRLINMDRYAQFAEIELFNPVVDDWNEEAQKREEEAKANAMMNLFVITPNMKGVFSIAEAIECSHNTSCKTFFAVFDKFNAFDKAQMKSLMATGKLVEEKENGYQIATSGLNSMETLVTAVLESLLK